MYVNGGETETENTCQRQCLNLSIHSPPLDIVPSPSAGCHNILVYIAPAMRTIPGMSP